MFGRRLHLSRHTILTAPSRDNKIIVIIIIIFIKNGVSRLTFLFGRGLRLSRHEVLTADTARTAGPVRVLVQVERVWQQQLSRTSDLISCRPLLVQKLHLTIIICFVCKLRFR